MLTLAIVFFLVAVVAALFGFTTIAGPAIGLAKLFFVIFLALAVLAAVVRALRGRPPV